MDCDRELGKALPALNAAVKSLEVLKPADIGEMRGYKEPPADLKLLISVASCEGRFKLIGNYEFFF